MKWLPLAAAVMLAGCGTITLGGSDGFEAPPIELTQEQRCAWYTARINALSADDSLSDFQSAALVFYTNAHAAACVTPES